MGQTVFVLKLEANKSRWLPGSIVGLDGARLCAVQREDGVLMPAVHVNFLRARVPEGRARPEAEVQRGVEHAVPQAGDNVPHYMQASIPTDFIGSGFGLAEIEIQPQNQSPNEIRVEDPVQQRERQERFIAELRASMDRLKQRHPELQRGPGGAMADAASPGAGPPKGRAKHSRRSLPATIGLDRPGGLQDQHQVQQVQPQVLQEHREVLPPGQPGQDQHLQDQQDLVPPGDLHHGVALPQAVPQAAPQEPQAVQLEAVQGVDLARDDLQEVVLLDQPVTPMNRRPFKGSSTRGRRLRSPDKYTPSSLTGLSFVSCRPYACCRISCP